jgi:hypothetical protein
VIAGHPEHLRGLGWGDVLRHAWAHIKDSGRVVLAGFIASAVLPPLYEWWDTYHWSHTGLDEVTSGNWESSLIGVAVWLVLVTIWHLMRAPIGHAREVMLAHDKHHAAEIERVRAESRPQVVTHVREQHNYFNLGENPDPAVIAALQASITTPELQRQIDAVEPRPTAAELNADRPKPLQMPQVEVPQADEQIDDTGQVDSDQ